MFVYTYIVSICKYTENVNKRLGLSDILSIDVLPLVL